MYKKVIKYLLMNLLTLQIVLQVAEINQTNYLGYRNTEML